MIKVLNVRVFFFFLVWMGVFVKVDRYKVDKYVY